MALCLPEALGAQQADVAGGAAGGQAWLDGDREHTQPDGGNDRGEEDPGDPLAQPRPRLLPGDLRRRRPLQPGNKERLDRG